jgi:DNA-directed RNA polymerase specialized sigma24 family protein
MSSENVWSEMEKGLDELYKQFVKDGDLRSRGMATLIEKVHPFVVANAARILNSPRFRYTKGDPESIVQRWWLIMDSVGFKTFDAAKGPLIAYAITILKRLCSGENRRGRLRQTQQLPFRAQSNSWGPRGSACKREWDSALRKAVRRLPKNPRRGFILKYVLHKSSEEGAKRCGLKSVATFDTWVHRARTLLREQLDPRDWLDEWPTKRFSRERRNYFWSERARPTRRRKTGD